MSDASQGHGWWEASDSKWYPPEDHPDYVDPRPPPPKRISANEDLGQAGNNEASSEKVAPASSGSLSQTDAVKTDSTLSALVFGFWVSSAGTIAAFFPWATTSDGDIDGIAQWGSSTLFLFGACALFTAMAAWGSTAAKTAFGVVLGCSLVALLFHLVAASDIEQYAGSSRADLGVGLVTGGIMGVLLVGVSFSELTKDRDE